jgi:hypothetical protein
MAGKQTHQQAFVSRIEMLDEYPCCVGCRRQCLDKLAARVEPTRRCADPDDKKVVGLRSETNV